ncbi:MAG: hypothetical protein ACPGWR_01560 [Ardenticatenaceae bacterium]
MQIVNLSDKPLAQLRNWLPEGLQVTRVVFFPEAQALDSTPIPNGVALLTHQANWQQFAVCDAGCGMRLLRSAATVESLTPARWNQLTNKLYEQGTLGYGNHFVDALLPHGGGSLYFLIHSGPTASKQCLRPLVTDEAAFAAEFDRLVQWAVDNRTVLQECIESIFGPTSLVVDLPHNTYERLSSGGVVIRKGVVALQSGALSVLPSHMLGDVALIRTTDHIEDALNSLSHGTGKVLEKPLLKRISETYDYDHLRERVLLPNGVPNKALRKIIPPAYGELDANLNLLRSNENLDGSLIDVVERYRVVAAIMGRFFLPKYRK